MKEWLISVTEVAVVVIDAMALLIVIVGTVVAFVGAFRALFSPLPGNQGRAVWLGYARWLVAGLTFQLAADIGVVGSGAPSEARRDEHQGRGEGCGTRRTRPAAHRRRAG